MTTHTLKIDAIPMSDLLSGAKTGEVRRDDRGFEVGDTAELQCADGRSASYRISHIQRGYGLPDGICVLSYAGHGGQVTVPFQEDATLWVEACVGSALAADLGERNRRLAEEACELLQAAGMSLDDIIGTARWVFAKPAGRVRGEIGDVMNSLAALASAHLVDMDAAARDKLEECWFRIGEIREKQKGKPVSFSPEDAPRAHDDNIQALAEEAFVAGAMAVHQEWRRAHEAGEGPPRGCPEFGEAASDFAAEKGGDA